MSVKFSRTAKLPPDPADIAILKNFREMLVELAEIGMSLARQAGADAGTPAEPAPSQTQPTIEVKGDNPPSRAVPAHKEAILVFNQLVRTIKTCMELHQKLGGVIATAHTTAEFAGLHHPNRQAILDYLHEAIRFEEPRQFQRSSHNDIEIRVSEELGYAPNRNPGDVIAEMCLHYRLPDIPDAYPNNWRPTPRPDDREAA